MRAVRYHEFGGDTVLRLEDVERPTPGPGQVLVHVAATSFNPVDDHIRAGYLEQMIPIALPHVPGIDLAGVVAELGTGVTGVHVGDRVVAMLPLDASGAASEYVLAPADALVSAPEAVDLVDAASLPLVGLAAWQALFELGELRSGQTVLVVGAGGAVGSVAVQLAVDAGAQVTASAGPRHADRLAGYGAQRVVDHLEPTQTATGIGGPFDVVVNLVRLPPEDAARLTSFVADGGIAVSTGTPVPEDPARGTRSAWVFVRSDAAQLRELVLRADDGRLRPHVIDRRSFTDLRSVHEDAGSGRLAGKTVLTVP